MNSMGRQMRISPFQCSSLNLGTDTYWEIDVQQVVLPEAAHLPSKYIQWDDHTSFSSGLIFFGVFFLWSVSLWSSTGDLAKEEQWKKNQECLSDLNLYRFQVGQERRDGDMLGLCFVTEALDLLFRAALPHVGCISKLPTMYPFNRKSHSSTQVPSNCYRT